jgi:lysine 2,3-aminomutase
MAALKRCRDLDYYSKKMAKHIKAYKSGYDEALIKKREKLKKDILQRFNATEQDWSSYKWHLDHVIRDSKTLNSLVKLNKKELEGVEFAEKNNIPFEVTPYYLSLFNKSGKCDDDRAIRSQVLPTMGYTSNVVRNRTEKKDLGPGFHG